MDKYIKLNDLMKFPIRIDNYDKVNGDENFVYGIEAVLEYAQELQFYEIMSLDELKLVLKIKG